LPDGPLRPELRPRLRGVSHQWAFFASVVTGIALVAAAPEGTATLAAAIYAVSVAALFGTSAIYHRVTWRSVDARRWMRRLDHSMIFFVIAGTYTPFALLALEGTIATVILVVVWVGAAGGIVLLRARDALERIVALDLITFICVALLALLAYLREVPYYLDAALALAALSFVATLAAARSDRGGGPFR